MNSKNHISPITSNFNEIRKLFSPSEKKVKIQTPKVEKESNDPRENEEWTEISLNSSPDEKRNNGEILEDSDQIPYKSLQSDLNSEGTNSSSETCNSRKKLITQKSLPAMIESNEISLTEEKKAQVTRSPSFKKKSKLDSCLATWISRNSVSSEISSCSSGR